MCRDEGKVKFPGFSILIPLLFSMIILVSGQARAAGDDRKVGAEGQRMDRRDRPTIDLFYKELAPHGEWVEDPDYGWMWSPSDVPWGWRPYTDGHWVYSDDDGWVWVSDWDWGWAPFHYGRWYYDDAEGRWFWLPGTEWAPAWVTWRSGGDWTGWAPLPPWVYYREGTCRYDWDEYFRDRSGYFHHGDQFLRDRDEYRRDREKFLREHGDVVKDPDDMDHAIGWHGWAFVRNKDFTEPKLGKVLALPAQNLPLIDKTKNATHYSFENNLIHNRSIPVAEIEKSAGRPVPRVLIKDHPQPGPVRFNGNEVQVFRPALSSAKPAAPPQIRQTPVPNNPDELNKKWAAVVHNLELKHEADRARLTQIHQNMSSGPPPSMSAGEIQRQREVEQQAQMEQHRLEMQQLHNAQQRQQRAVLSRGTPAPQRREGGETRSRR